MSDSNQYELNKGDNFIFGVDVSASMGIKDCPPGNTSRIEYLKERVNSFIVQAEKLDEDGIDLVIFGHEVVTKTGVTSAKAAEIIAPLKADQGSTDTAGAIRAAYELHKKGGYAQTFFFLATDGAPTNQVAVFETIASITNEIKNEHEFAISVLVVGTADDKLKEFLEKLDDAIPGAKYDIVDVKRLDEVGFEAAAAGALHD